ncbi:hypothetical protein [Bacillus sp. FJAT-45350]|uniref:hypothetical protein n=1 Tax=Bacillus sp. FJAT-45350 TaxID=2011014 RepID=UPI000BB75DA7|nr:hypothetical protein [Bacillus sp. FJAT-45350]
MFTHIETINNREIYTANYNSKDFRITYNPENEQIEQVIPLSVGTDYLVNEFRRYIEKHN